MRKHILTIALIFNALLGFGQVDTFYIGEKVAVKTWKYYKSISELNLYDSYIISQDSVVIPFPLFNFFRSEENLFVTKMVEGKVKHLPVNPYYVVYRSKNRKVFEGVDLDGNMFWGNFKTYHRNGNLKLEGCIYNEMKEEKWKYYNRKGVLKRIEIWEKGKLISSEKK